MSATGDLGGRRGHALTIEIKPNLLPVRCPTFLKVVCLRFVGRPAWRRHVCAWSASTGARVQRSLEWGWGGVTERGWRGGRAGPALNRRQHLSKTPTLARARGSP